jgi:hypothetical protein
MLRKILMAAALVGALGASACGSYGPTPYQPATSMDGGYSETRIENDRFRISFRGNSLTGRDRVETYMLFRAAELTLQQGYDNFTIVDRDTNKDDRVRQYGGYMGTRLSYMYFVPRYGWVASYEPYWTPSTYSQITRYEAFAEIILSRGPKGGDPNTFNAREVQANLGPSVVRPSPA